MELIPREGTAKDQQPIPYPTGQQVPSNYPARERAGTRERERQRERARTRDPFFAAGVAAGIKAKKRRTVGSYRIAPGATAYCQFCGKEIAEGERYEEVWTGDFPRPNKIQLRDRVFLLKVCLVCFAGKARGKKKAKTLLDYIKELL